MSRQTITHEHATARHTVTRLINIQRTLIQSIEHLDDIRHRQRLSALCDEVGAVLSKAAVAGRDGNYASPDMQRATEWVGRMDCPQMDPCHAWVHALCPTQLQ